MKNIIPFVVTILAIAYLGILASCQKPESKSVESTPTYDHVANAIWIENFDLASKQAKAENKYMLLDFTGSDWCGWCITLNNEVFSKDSFQSYAKDNLVLVELDFPQTKKQSDEIKKQNNALAQKYGIRGFPTILILNSEGELVAQTGYRRGGPDAYVAYLKEVIAKAKKG